MRTPILAVARFAVHILVGPIAGDDRVQRFRAVVALVALAMPFAALRQDQLGCVNGAAAARTTLAGGCLDFGRVNGASLRGEVTASRMRMFEIVLSEYDRVFSC